MEPVKFYRLLYLVARGLNLIMALPCCACKPNRYRLWKWGIHSTCKLPREEARLLRGWSSIEYRRTTGPGPTRTNWLKTLNPVSEQSILSTESLPAALLQIDTIILHFITHFNAFRTILIIATISFPFQISGNYQSCLQTSSEPGYANEACIAHAYYFIACSLYKML